MVIKITKKYKKGKKHTEYKTDKKIITPQDIKEADRFDLFLSKEIRKIEEELKKEKAVSKEGIKTDPIMAWYIVGKHINEFIKNNNIEVEDRNRFWDYLYGRSSLINKTFPVNVISKSRNDFRSASLLAKYSPEIIKGVGPWSLWREILGYKSFLNDERILKFIINELTKSPRTREVARPFLKAISNRFKKIDTSVLNDQELLNMLNKTK